MGADPRSSEPLRSSDRLDRALEGLRRLVPAQAQCWEMHRARKAEAKAARAEAAVTQPDDDVPASSVAPVVLPAPRPAAAIPAPVVEPEFADVEDDQELVLEDLTPDQVRDWRVRAMKDHSVVFDHIDCYGEPSARRLLQPAGQRSAAPCRARAPEPRLLHLGAVVSGGEVSGVDLARQALNAAREAARQNGATRQKPKRRTTTVVRRDGREPLGLGSAINRMMTERGMAAPAADGSVLADFDTILAAVAPELAGRVQAVAFDAETGRLDVAPDAPVVGTQLRWSAPKLVATANERVSGANVRARSSRCAPATHPGHGPCNALLPKGPG